MLKKFFSNKFYPLAKISHFPQLQYRPPFSKVQPKSAVPFPSSRPPEFRCWAASSKPRGFAGLPRPPRGSRGWNSCEAGSSTTARLPAATATPCPWPAPSWGWSFCSCWPPSALAVRPSSFCYRRSIPSFPLWQNHSGLSFVKMFLKLIHFFLSFFCLNRKRVFENDENLRWQKSEIDRFQKKAL